MLEFLNNVGLGLKECELTKTPFLNRVGNYWFHW